MSPPPLKSTGRVHVVTLVGIKVLWRHWGRSIVDRQVVTAVGTWQEVVLWS